MTQNDLPAWATDPECPWWAKLRRAEYLIDEIDKQYRALNTPGAGWRIDQETDDQALVYRLRLLRPISADFAALVGDAIHNLRSSLDQVVFHLAVKHSGQLSADAERMSGYPIRITGDKFNDWATGRDKRTKLCRADIFGPVGIRAIRSVQPFAIAEEAEAVMGQSWENASGRSAADEMANDAGHVLNTLWNVDKHRRLPALAWVISLVSWGGTGDRAPTTARMKLPLVDGQVLARDEQRVTEHLDREVYFDFELDLLDSPAQGGSPLVRTLVGLHRSLCGWMIPRMLIVGEGHEPPMMISFAPPRPPS